MVGWLENFEKGEKLYWKPRPTVAVALKEGEEAAAENKNNNKKIKQ
jgi:hypothetical protein